MLQQRCLSLMYKTYVAVPERRQRGNFMIHICGADLKHILPETLASKCKNCSDNARLFMLHLM